MEQSNDHHVLKVLGPEGQQTDVLIWGEEWLSSKKLEKPEKLKQTTLQKLFALLRTQ